MLNYSGQTDADVVFHALSDPTRRHIVEQLGRGPASVSQLAAPLPMSMPAVVQHLQVLEASGLIESQKVGRVRTCRLVVKRLDTVQDWIEARRAAWERRLDRLGEFLAEQENQEKKDKKEQP
ncbi:MAG TPA: metalloregulator ArsR/SmtB family transcription factor [Jatrophihabitans sp.]|nr:metalloregulator ArsR/SmtB family transcription factor [Jatrophihabitans sp.]